MASKAPRILFAPALWLAALLAGMSAAPAVAAIAGSTAEVAQAAAERPDPAYQRLVDAANAVVGIRVTALPGARTNASVGPQRTGSGVIIAADGLVLTASYLVAEADQVEVTDSAGQTVPATVVAADEATGFGLVRTLTPLSPKPIPLGDSRPVSALDRLMIVTGGPQQAISLATVVSRRRFAGYWEYLIDHAIFTSPPRLDHSGAALVNQNGELVGVGSLFVMDALKGGERLPGNMFLPIDLLKPVLDELVRTGSQGASHRPWLGVDSLEEDGRVKVLEVSAEGPADRAGIAAGDIILSLDGQPVDDLEGFYRTLWQQGPAGVDVRLTVLHGSMLRDVVVRSMDQNDFLRRKPPL